MHTYQLPCYLVTLLLCSVNVLIVCVQIVPNFEVISIWNTDRKFVVCNRDRKELEGRVQWYGPNGRPVGVSHLSAVYQVEAVGTSKLFFVRPYKVNSGVYVCKHYKDDVLVNEEQFEMKIFKTIDMTGNIEQFKKEEGGTLVMYCVARFDTEASEAQIVWSHENNKLITNFERYKIESNILGIYSHRIINSTLTITKVESGDAGFYICQAIYANEYMSDIKSFDVEVIVQYKPKFQESPIKVMWLNEENNADNEFILELRCKAYADPVGKFEWYIGNLSLLDNIAEIPSFIEILAKEHMSIMTIRLKNMAKFKYYVKELKDNQKNISCKASNSYGSDTLVYDFKFGMPPRTAEILYMDLIKESGLIYLEINYTEADPPIDMFKLVLSKSYQVYFNQSHKTREKYKDNFFKIPFDRNVHVEYLDLFAHNPVGWSRPLEMQDTTHSTVYLTDQDYKWELSNFQICVLLFILFLFVASTTFQVVYFNYCVPNSDQDG